jgi:hypothetical protein
LTGSWNRTRNGGGEIVGLLNTGSAYYAPSAAAANCALYRALASTCLAEAHCSIEDLGDCRSEHRRRLLEFIATWRLVPTGVVRRIDAYQAIQL